MAGKILITAETGSDITKEMAMELGVTLIPMHVSLGSETLDDGTFPAEEVCAYYDRTGKCPTTSGSTPYDFESVYDKLFAEENADLATKLEIKQAPTLVIVKGDSVEKIVNVSNIRKFAEEA